ncbi:MAG: energy transducer TonB [Allomuricauda sp.]
MELKKNPNLELKRNNTLYFFVGMTLILLLAYMALEWKTYYPVSEWEIGQVDPKVLFEETPPITIQKLPPPPKIQAPPVIEIAEDDEDIIETIIESSETNENTEITPLEGIEVAEEEEEPVIIIDLIEEAPVFPGCENAEDKRACFQEKVLRHVKKTFRYPEMAIEMNLQGRVTTQFIIGKDGNIEGLKLHGPDQILKDEAARIISKLPRVRPGKQNGKNVRVVFTLPINFKIQ